MDVTMSSAPSSHYSLPADSKPPEVGSRLEVKRLDKIYDSKTEKWIFKDSALAPAGSASDDAYAEYAFTIIRDFQKKSSGSTHTTIIQINSPLLRRVGKDIIGELEDVAWDAQYLVVDLQIFLAFFPQLSDHLASLTPEDPTYAPLKSLTRCLEDDNSQVLKEIRSHIGQNQITFDLLWAILLSNRILYMACPITSEICCVRLVKATLMEGSLLEVPRWDLRCQFVDVNRTNGHTRYGFASITPSIEHFNGVCDISSLSIFPIKWYQLESVETLKNKLIDRGKIWEGLDGILHRYYHGTAFGYRDRRFLAFSIKSRIMVDGDSYSVNASGAPRIYAYVKALDDDLRLLTTPVIYGFSLSDKFWLAFRVSQVKEVPWDDEAVTNLILPEEQQSLINSLVARYITQPSNRSFDDFVEGKGLGLVFNLHGPAGVGKTLTVEATSAHFKHPLYVVGAGDLGTTANALDTHLGKALKLSHRWNALVLIDEADVFLEERSLHELERNAMVAVFLRHMEYFCGIIFLTTNRVDAFDEAFQSRIHVSLRYRDLRPQAKRLIWLAFLRKAAQGSDNYPLTDDQVQDLSEKKLNGRQIKNVVKIADSLARGRVNSPHIRYTDVTLALDTIYRLDARVGSSSKTGRIDPASEAFGFGKGVWILWAIWISALVLIQYGVIVKQYYH